MRRLTSTFTGLLSLLLLSAAPSPNTDTAKSELKKLDFLVGQWKGEGWIQMGPDRHEFTGTETVQRKIAGLSLLVEGNFREKEKPADAPPIHETLGVLSWDNSRKHYWFNTWLNTGRSGQYEARLIADKTLQWTIPIPQGHIRYTMKLDDQQRWSETGEMSPDNGKSWHPFFQMTLTKLPA